ncbi:hypothetical protein PTMSG1_01646 [Pyrenophora teres f. maculata]|nr:hypothetical protein PTMSG1_01646 [Pyrenophora teres f. maculata]
MTATTSVIMNTAASQPNKSKFENQVGYERTYTVPQVQELPSITDLQRFTQALQDGTAFHVDTYRPNYNNHSVSPYRPERPHLSRNIVRPSNVAELGAIFAPKKVHLERQNRSSVSFCDHQEFYITWQPDDPHNHHGSYKPHMQRFEDRSPWVQHQNCPPPDILACIKKLAKRIIRKFEDMENGRLSYLDIKDGKSPRRAPTIQRVEREVQNMYSQMFRGKYDAIVEKKEAIRAKIDAGTRRKEQAEQIRLQAQLDRQRRGIAKGLDVDDLEDDTLVAKQKTKKTPKQTAEDRVQRSLLRKGLTVKTKACSEPGDRYKITKKTKVALNTPSLSNGKAAKELTKEVSKLSSQTSKSSASNGKKLKDFPTNEDAATASSTKKHKSAAIIEDSDEEADYPLPEAPLPPSTLPEEVVSAPVREEWFTEAEELVEELHQYEEEREAAAEKNTEHVTTPTSATPTASTAGKRKRRAADEEQDEDTASLTAESSPRPVKKAKKSIHPAEAESPVALTRRDSVVSAPAPRSTDAPRTTTTAPKAPKLYMLLKSTDR